MARRCKICLVLGAGGVRGLSHLGVLQVLEREGIPIDYLVGTSAGSIVGAAYALEPDAMEITRRALEYFGGEEFERSSFSALIPDSGGRNPVSCRMSSTVFERATSSAISCASSRYFRAKRCR